MISHDTFDRIPIPAVASGRGWLVIDKPVGMSVHNDPGTDLCSILSAYFESNEKAAKSIAYHPQYGLHPVHRLDKDTSGIILLSCRRRVFDHLARQFAQGKVSKRYLALVHGAIATGEDWKRWNWPLTTKASGRRNPQGSGRRSSCKTAYRLVQLSRHYSLIECRLGTGRTHQIRRHAALAGHPLLGDRRYGSLRACRYLEKNLNFKRLGLHSHRIGIQVPDAKTPLTITSGGLPHALKVLMVKDSDPAPNIIR